MPVENREQGISRQLEAVRSGILGGLPVCAGYFAVSVSLGVITADLGMPAWVAGLFSLCAYAGAAQFMAVGLLAAATPVWQIVVATFLINLRHFLMSASVASRMQRYPRPLGWLFGVGMTDEVFSVASLQQGNIQPLWLMAAELTAWSGWVAGTVAGNYLGAVLPVHVSQSLAFGLYALFITGLVPMVGSNRRGALAALLAAVLHTLLRQTPLSGGWALVLAMLAASLVVAVLPGKERVQA